MQILRQADRLSQLRKEFERYVGFLTLFFLGSFFVPLIPHYAGWYELSGVSLILMGFAGGLGATSVIIWLVDIPGMRTEIEKQSASIIADGILLNVDTLENIDSDRLTTGLRNIQRVQLSRKGLPAHWADLIESHWADIIEKEESRSYFRHTLSYEESPVLPDSYVVRSTLEYEAISRLPPERTITVSCVGRLSELRQEFQNRGCIYRWLISDQEEIRPEMFLVEPILVEVTDADLPAFTLTSTERESAPYRLSHVHPVPDELAQLIEAGRSCRYSISTTTLHKKSDRKLPIFLSYPLDGQLEIELDCTKVEGISQIGCHYFMTPRGQERKIQAYSQAAGKRLSVRTPGTSSVKIMPVSGVMFFW